MKLFRRCTDERAVASHVEVVGSLHHRLVLVAVFCQRQVHLALYDGGPAAWNHQRLTIAVLLLCNPDAAALVQCEEGHTVALEFLLRQVGVEDVGRTEAYLHGTLSQ